MKLFSKAQTLPLGAIRARGFLKDQLLRCKDGMGGHLPEIEPGMIADPYIRKTVVKQWEGKADTRGWGAEISGNFYAGFIQLAFTLDDRELIGKATAWVDEVLTHQREDGYLGTYDQPGDPIYDDYNAWGTYCGMRALLYFYEATGREDVFRAVYRCMLWFAENWAGERKTTYAGPTIMETALYCHRKTGDERLLRFAEEYSDFLCAHPLFRNSWQSLAEPRLLYNSTHTANYGSIARLPALLYASNGDKRLLRASETGYNKIYRKGTHVTGAPVSVTEYIGPVAGTHESEYCTFTFFNSGYIEMGAVTGNAVWGERSEEVVYNAAQGARRKDERAIAYLTSPNQLFATRHSSDVKDMQVYAPCYPVSCCPVNAVAIIPEFVRGMAMKDRHGALCISAYGPAEICYDGWHIVEDTYYPFRDTVDLHVETERKNTLRLRVPTWSAHTKMTMDGVENEAVAAANGFVSVPLAAGKHEITLRFEAKVEVVHVDDRDAYRKQPLCFRRGALVFSFHVKEDWKPYYPKTETPLTPEWPWYEVYPVYERFDTHDAHEALAMRRDHFEWSLAVDETIRPEDLTAEFHDTVGYPWENPWVTLRLPAYHTPLQCSAYPKRTFEPFGDRQDVAEAREVTLVPYGVTNLRLTYFPRANLTEKAK